MTKEKIIQTIHSIQEEFLHELDTQTDEEIRVILTAKVVAVSQILDAIEE